MMTQERCSRYPMVGTPYPLLQASHEKEGMSGDPGIGAEGEVADEVFNARRLLLQGID
jgi:hypothetical protein